MVSHLIESVHKLYKKYSSPLFVILGDFNDLNVDELCDACKLKQVVRTPTRNQAILDLILTNESSNFYKDPVSLPNIGGSDHLSVLYEPIILNQKGTPKRKIFIRKFSKSAILEFGFWITSFKWTLLLKIEDVNQKICYFTNIMWVMIDKFFPLVAVMSTSNDKEWITPNIKRLMAERQKAHLAGKNDVRDYLPWNTKQEIK